MFSLEQIQATFSAIPEDLLKRSKEVFPHTPAYTMFTEETLAEMFALILDATCLQSLARISSQEYDNELQEHVLIFLA